MNYTKLNCTGLNITPRIVCHRVNKQYGKKQHYKISSDAWRYPPGLEHKIFEQKKCC